LLAKAIKQRSIEQFSTVSTLKPIKEMKKKKTLDQNGKETTKTIVLPFIRFRHGKLENTLKRQGLNMSTTAED
jgi:hypothetical protein